MNEVRKNGDHSSPELANSTSSTSKIFLPVISYLAIHCNACVALVDQSCPKIT